MLEKVAMKNGKSIETDNCITTIIYILSFTVTMFMYMYIGERFSKQFGDIIGCYN
jgi:hypothetical protein